MNLKHGWCCSAAIAALAAAFPSHAQTTEASPPATADTEQSGAASALPPQDPDALGDVVVTAERRDSSVQRTAMNITAVTGDSLTAQGIRSVADLSAAVPGLNLTQSSPNTYLGFYGLASGSGTPWADSVMAFNYGGVSLARPIASGSSMFDVERIEVLKGPQGTLYGKNATVGALNIIPARPTDRFEGNLSVTTGNYKTINTTGAVNLPLSETLAARFAWQTTHHDGYLTSGYDDANNYSGRLSLQWKPNSDVSLLLWSDLYRNRSKGQASTWRYYFAGQEWINPDNPWQDLGAPGCSDQRYCPNFALESVGGINRQGNNAGGATANGFTDLSPTGFARLPITGRDGYDNENQDIYAGEFNLHTGVGRLTVIGAHVENKVDYKNYAAGLITRNSVSSHQNSAEVRLASEGGASLKWVLGAFYFDEMQHALQEGWQTGGVNLQYSPHLKDTNYAGFADITLSVTDRLRLLGGLRYTNERKSQDGYNIVNGLALTGAGGVDTLRSADLDCYLGSNTPNNYADVANTIDRTKYPVLGDSHFPSNICMIPNGGRLETNNVSGKIGFEFDVAPASMLYATAKTGFRSGGFGPGTQNTYKPEKLTAFEAGSKNRFLNGKLQLNLSAFYWKYNDQQLSQLQQFFFDGAAVGQFAYPTNIDGNVYGGELDLQVALSHQDKLRFDGMWTRGKLDKTPFLVNSSGVVAPLIDVDRYNLPEWVFTAGYDHRFDLSNGGSILFGVQTHYESSAIMRLQAANAIVPGDIRHPYALVDGNLSYTTPDDKIEVQLFVKNLTNKAVPGVSSSGQVGPGIFFQPNTTSFTTANGATVADVRAVTLNPPRTYGIRLSSRF